LTIPLRAEKFEPFNIAPAWLAKKGMIEVLAKAIVFGDKILMDFKDEVPASQVAEWLAPHLGCERFVTRFENFTTWGATADAG
jgi:hypothetical protein